jgi:hypothetical protein
MRSDPTLKKWYRLINKKFFDGQLTNSVCVRWANEDDDDEEEKCEEKCFGWADKADDSRHEYVIVLSRVKINSLSVKLLTLAHEMCHIATGVRDDHGPAFEYWREHIGDRGIFKKGALVKGLTIF